MPKPTFLNLPDEKRLRITELAIDEFSSHPYRQASLSRIVARAGIAKGSMYQYFENKLDLYQWLVVDELDSRRRQWLDARGEQSPQGLFEVLEHQAVANVGFLLAHPRLARLAVSAMEPTGDPELSALHSRLRTEKLDALTAHVGSAQQQGEVRTDLDARALAHMLMAMIYRGLPDAVLASMGVDVHGFLANPELVQAHDEGQWRALVRQSMALIRSGIADDSQASSSASPEASASASFEPKHESEPAVALAAQSIDWRGRDEVSREAELPA